MEWGICADTFVLLFGKGSGVMGMGPAFVRRVVVVVVGVWASSDWMGW